MTKLRTLKSRARWYRRFLHLPIRIAINAANSEAVDINTMAYFHRWSSQDKWED